MDIDDGNAKNLKDELYLALIDSPLGVVGAEQTLPGLEGLLRELRQRRVWEQKRPRRLKDEQLIGLWATYRHDLLALKERICQRTQQDFDELLSWLVLFVLDHVPELEHISGLYERKFQLVLDGGEFGGLTPENALAMRDDWQAWAVVWLRNALLDEGLDAAPSARKDKDESGGGDGDGGSDPESRLAPKPAPTFEF